MVEELCGRGGQSGEKEREKRGAEMWKEGRRARKIVECREERESGGAGPRPELDAGSRRSN